MTRTEIIAPELYPYQRTGVDAVLAELHGKGRDAALIVHPTGTGKTYLGCAVADAVRRQDGGRTLILAYRGELLRQWADSCDAFGLSWTVEKAEEKALHRSLSGLTDVVLGSINTLRGDRLGQWPANYFDMILYDEAHHGTSPTSVRIFQHFPKAKRLGLTATPERGDGESIQQVFGDCVHEYPFWKAIDDGFLVPPLFRYPATTIDLSKIDIKNGDLAQGDLEEEISGHVEELVNAVREHCGDLATLGFTPKVKSAQAFADGLRQVGVVAKSVHGKSEDRDTVVAGFLREDYQALISCAMLLEGFDARHVGALAMARPTTSSIVFRQMLGRGLRTYPGKEFCLILDFARNSGKHDLFRPIDLFDTSGMDLDVLNLADGLLKAGKAEDPREALKEAEKIHRAEVAARVRVKMRETRYDYLAYDPFAVGGLLGVPKKRRAANSLPVTHGQLRRLEGYKLKASPDDLTRVEANRLLAELDDRRRKNLATHRQVALLVSQGVPPEQARSFAFEEAKGDLDILIGLKR
jgi:superfamily II DNA or RNA helicase